MAEPGRRISVTAARRVGMAGVLALVLVSCSSEPADQSSTPRITADPSSAVSDGLLTQAEVERVLEIGELQVQDIGDIPVFENPDPRGPCGGVVPGLPLDGAAGRAFGGSTFVLVQLITPESTAGTEYLRAIQDDAHPGTCGPFESLTNTGATQTVSEIEFVDLGTARDSLAWTSRVASGSEHIFAGVALVQLGDRFVFLQAQSSTAIDPRVLQALIELVTSKPPE